MRARTKMKHDHDYDSCTMIACLLLCKVRTKQRLRLFARACMNMSQRMPYSPVHACRLGGELESRDICASI
jgi:hypothetical protein